ncbi:peptide chain release factor 2 [Candidatus Parcubacteria bacterium]|nr:MAG: peptide chain release factor 2 [Candidatus Parcubacteria bacterium]
MQELDDQMSQPDFWADTVNAKAVSRHAEEMRQEIKAWTDLRKNLDELLKFSEEAKAEADLQAEIEKKYFELKNQYEKLEFQVLLAGQHDEKNAIFAIHAGTGGVDAQDWAEMLLRMLIRFCEKKGWAAKIVDESRGQEAGIKSATVIVEGRYAYGYLKSEAGVHRLVRISPYDAEKMRHTSFALVEVLPEFNEVEEIPIEEKDLRIDTFLSSGHGGQSVQTTYSAVRIVHIPTNIVVTCQNERSQKQNKETAMKILRAKLHRISFNKQQAEKQELRGAYSEAAWGNQIRSYVLQPYKLVKDHRTEVESHQPDEVLNGDLDKFIEGYLRWSAGKK